MSGEKLLKFDEPLSMDRSMNASRVHQLAHSYITGRVQRREILKKTGNCNLITLRSFAKIVGDRPVDRVSRSDVERWIASRAHLSVGSRRLEFSILRGFIHWLREHRHLRNDPMLHIKGPKPPRRVPKALARDDVLALINVLPDNRAKAVFALARGLGLRRAEVATVEVADWDRSGRTIRVIGKGGHERDIPVTDWVTTALIAYLDDVRITAGPIIRNALNPHAGISPNRVGALMRAWMEEAGIKHTSCDGRGTHALRHTLASEVADVEADLRVVQQILGHVSLSSTQIYLRRTAMPKVRAAMEAAA